ncbi:MAG: RpiB/LacA/LacB family sugar-phosphate isomerase [Candidatus Paceibacterota bacterium]|jgi:ribose 5-phosphate isomerase B
MKVYIGTDHAGFELKEKLIPFLKELGYQVEDKGAYEFNPNDDYPDFITPVAKAVAEDKGSFGIIMGGSGEGEAMDANRVEGVRAIEYYGKNMDIIKLGREHNDANILSLGVRFMDEDEAIQSVKKFLETKFSGDARHLRRIDKIDSL